MIAIGADHGGYELKKEILKYFDESGIEYKDFGCYSTERVDYPNVAKEVAKAVQNKSCETGILICRSGYGMAIVANKFKGIRSVTCYEEQNTKFARMHNDANLLTIGADYVTVNKAICIIRMWLATEFEGGRHSERVQLITDIENENFK